MITTSFTARKFFFKSLRCPLAGTGLMLLFCAHAQATDYTLGRGDQVEITVSAGAQWIKKSQIGVNGAVALPLLGEVHIAGLSPSSASLKISTLYRERKIYDQVETLVEVSEYRPVFVMGMVSKPGPYAFRPGMTIRQLVAMAGGYELIAQSEGQLPSFLRKDYFEAVSRYVVAQVRAQRFRAAAERKSSLDMSGIDFAEINPETFSESILTETAQHKEALANLDNEISYIEKSKGHIAGQLVALEKQIEEETRNVEIAQADLNRLNEAFGKGIVSAPRLGDTQQTLALVKIRQAEGIARKAQTERLLADTARRSQRLVSEFKLNALEALKQQTVEIEVARSAVAAAREALDKARVRPQARTQDEPQFVVHSAGSKVGALVDANHELEAGDTLTIASGSRNDTGARQQ